MSGRFKVIFMQKKLDGGLRKQNFVFIFARANIKGY